MNKYISEVVYNIKSFDSWVTNNLLYAFSLNDNIFKSYKNFKHFIKIFGSESFISFHFLNSSQSTFS